MEVKDESSHLSFGFVIGGGFFSIEVVESNVGVEESDGVVDSGGVVNSGSRFEDVHEGGCFEECGEEEIPLEVGQGEELFRGRHREPKTGDDPSFYSVRENFISPFQL